MWVDLLGTVLSYELRCFLPLLQHVVYMNKKQCREMYSPFVYDDNYFASEFKAYAEFVVDTKITVYFLFTFTYSKN